MARGQKATGLAMDKQTSSQASTHASTQASTRTGVVQMTLAMTLSGTIGIFVTESQQSSFNVVFFRCVIGALCLAGFCLARGYFKRSYFTSRNLLLIALGGVCIVFNWVFLFKSYRLTSISLGTVLYHTQPFYVVLLGALVFRQDRVRLNKVAWICLAFLGMVLVTGLASGSAELSAGYSQGIVFSLLAAVLYAIATLSAKRLKGVPPHLIALCQLALGIVLLVPFTALGEVPLWGSHWFYLGTLGVVHTCIMYILLYSAFQKLDTTKIAVLAFIYPVVAMFADFAFYGTRLSLLQLAGVVLILLSGVAVNRDWGIGLRLADKARGAA
jgi:drug/metabolite transporter (DMT)-like permease